MITNIVPLRRFPRSFESFTYKVPEEYQATLEVGQLVQIPFRNSQEFGIVLSLDKNETKDTLKPIHHIVCDVPLVSAEYIEFLRKISHIYGISLGALAETFLPQFGARTSKNLFLSPLPSPPSSSELPLYKKYFSSQDHKQTLSDSIEGQTLIFVPEKQCLKVILDMLPPDLQSETVLWHGDLKTKEKRNTWFQIRNNEKKIIIGTRSAISLPLVHLKTLIVDYEHHSEYKNSDQAPRFDLKDITPYIRAYTGAREIHMSYTPSVTSYYFLHKGGYQNKNIEETLSFETIKKDHLPRIVDMDKEKKGGNYSPLSEEMKIALKESTEDIFLLVNRKGAARILICKDCRYEENCSQCGLPLVYHEKEKLLKCHYCKTQKPFPLVCPKCHSTELEQKGMGTESIEKNVREMVGNKKNIIRIDSEENSPPKISSSLPKIIIGTEKAIETVEWEKTGLISIIDFDRQVTFPEYKTSENVWQLIQEIQHARRPDSVFYIQTYNPQHLICRSLREPHRWYRTELNTRKTVGYPPYTFLVRYFGGNMNASASPQEAAAVSLCIEKILTKETKKGTLTGPIELQPKYFKGKFWYGIIIKLDSQEWYTPLDEINQCIPSHWKIDPNPKYLLQP